MRPSAEHDQAAVVWARIGGIGTGQYAEGFRPIEQRIELAGNDHIQIHAHNPNAGCDSPIALKTWIEHPQAYKTSGKERFIPWPWFKQDKAMWLLQAALQTAFEPGDVLPIIFLSPNPSCDGQVDRHVMIPMPLWPLSCLISRNVASSRKVAFNSAHTCGTSIGA